MKNFLPAFVFILFLCSCSDVTSPSENTDSVYTIEISYTYAPTEYTGQDGAKLYAVWLENREEGFFRTVFIGNRINLQNLTGIGAPYWQFTVRPHCSQEELDTVSGATRPREDFTLSTEVAVSEVETFKVCFETDHSWDGNDWFTDQPAIVYAADVDLGSNTGEYPMEFIGWVPDNGAETALPDISPLTAINETGGELQTETRYITHSKHSSYDYESGYIFGDEFIFDPIHPEEKGPATDLVKGGLTVKVSRK